MAVQKAFNLNKVEIVTLARFYQYFILAKHSKTCLAEHNFVIDLQEL
jgi:hypothetical protein